MGQMIDGLALGETTPGPLIMLVAFVGFVGAWTKAALGSEALVAAGMIGAAVATWFTFLPSFVFILAGGPLRRAHARRRSPRGPALRDHRGRGGRDREPRASSSPGTCSGREASAATPFSGTVQWPRRRHRRCSRSWRW